MTTKIWYLLGELRKEEGVGLRESLARNFLKDKSAPAGPTGQSPGFSQMPMAVGNPVPGSIFSRLSEPVVAPAVVSAEVDPELHDALLSAMNKVPAPGVQEFLLTAEGLASAIPQAQIARVALGVVGKKNITVAQIQGELSKRLTALDSQYNDFLSASERQYNVDVGSKESELTSVDQKITELQTRRAQLQEEISAKRQKIESKKTGLAAAYSKLKQEAALLQNQVSS